MSRHSRSDAFYKRLVKDQIRKRKQKQILIPPTNPQEVEEHLAKKAAIAAALAERPVQPPQPPPKRKVKVKTFAQELLTRQTRAELRLWDGMKKSALRIITRRQVPFGSYVVDFWIREWRLVIELDGSSHYGREDYDRQRQQYIEEHYGVTFLRFDNRSIHNNLDEVIETIEQFGEAYLLRRVKRRRRGSRRLPIGADSC